MTHVPCWLRLHCQFAMANDAAQHPQVPSCIQHMHCDMSALWSCICFRHLPLQSHLLTFTMIAITWLTFSTSLLFFSILLSTSFSF